MTHTGVQADCARTCGLCQVSEDIRRLLLCIGVYVPLTSLYSLLVAHVIAL